MTNEQNNDFQICLAFLCFSFEVSLANFFFIFFKNTSIFSNNTMNQKIN